MEAATRTGNFTAGLQRLTTNMEASTSTDSVTAGPERFTDVRAGTQDKKAVALGGERYLTTSDFKGKIYVHIRQYFTYPNAGTTPVATKKGIALTPEQWIVIHRKAHLVTEALNKLMESTHRISSGEKLKLVLGRNTYVTITLFNDKLYVHIRKYSNVPSVGEVPTKTGIALTPEQWMVLARPGNLRQVNELQGEEEVKRHFDSSAQRPGIQHCECAERTDVWPIASRLTVKKHSYRLERSGMSSSAH